MTFNILSACKSTSVSFPAPNAASICCATSASRSVVASNPRMKPIFWGVALKENRRCLTCLNPSGGRLTEYTTSFDGFRSEERRVGKSVDLGGRRIIKKKREKE